MLKSDCPASDDREMESLKHKIGWAAKLDRAARKGMRRIYNSREIGDCAVIGEKSEIENVWRNKITQTVFAKVAMVEVAVLVCDLRLTGFNRMDAFFFGVGCCNVLKRMRRRKDNRGGDRQQQDQIEYGNIFFHPYKCNPTSVKISPTFCETDINYRFVQLKTKTNKTYEKITIVGFANFDVLL